MTATADKARAKKITLIEQLLAKAESTTPEEAAALTAAAEKLMLRLNIDEAMLFQGRGESSDAVVRRDLFLTGTYARAQSEMICVAVNALGSVYAVYARNSSGSFVDVQIYGRPGAADQAIRLANSLLVQCATSYAVWWKDAHWSHQFPHRHEKRTIKREFVLGFGLGAALRITSEKCAAVSETPGSELVLASELDRAREAAGEVTDKPIQMHHVTASNAGREAGLAADVGTSPVGGAGRAAINA